MDERVLQVAREFYERIAPIYGESLVELRVYEESDPSDPDDWPTANVIVVLDIERPLAGEVWRLGRIATDLARSADIDVQPWLFSPGSWADAAAELGECSLLVAA